LRTILPIFRLPEPVPEKWKPVFGNDPAPQKSAAGWRFEEKPSYSGVQYYSPNLAEIERLAGSSAVEALCRPG